MSLFRAGVEHYDLDLKIPSTSLIFLKDDWIIGVLYSLINLFIDEFNI